MPDFHGENSATCHLTFAVEIRHCLALGDMDYDNHTGRGEQVYMTWIVTITPVGASKYMYTYIMHNASTYSGKVNAYIPKAWPKI